MNPYIAYCGLNCAECEAYLATVNSDNALREKVAIVIGNNEKAKNNLTK